MWLLPVLFAVAAAFNGILAGASVDVALVKLPTRRRIGALAYADFARGNDLANGLFFYPSLAVAAALLAFASTIAAFVSPSSQAIRVLLTGASFTSVLHFVATALAAPVMLGLREAPRDEAALTRLFDRFTRRHAFRTVFQVMTFLVILAALTLSH
jgi:hypothetical protein